MTRATAGRGVPESEASTVEEVESAWAEILRLRGELVVARDRGVPDSASPRHAAALAERLQRRCEELDDLIARVAIPEQDGDARPVLEAIKTALLSMADDVPAEGAYRATAKHASRRTYSRAVQPFTEAAAPAREDPLVLAQRIDIYGRYGVAAAAVRVGAETLDRLTIVERLAKLDSSFDRRMHFEALAPIWETVDGDGGPGSPYRSLLRATAERWSREGSPIEASASALGLPLSALEPMLWSILGAWRGVLAAPSIEPWDFRFLCGGAARLLDPLAPVERLRPLNDSYLETIGASPETAGVRYDLFPVDGRPIIPVAHAVSLGPIPDGTGGWTARRSWVFATYLSGGIANLAELLHESGHALHLAAVRARPAFSDVTDSSLGFFEAMADVLGWDADEPIWQQRWLGAAASSRDAILHRYGAIVLDICWALFEVALYRDPGLRPNDVWAEITEKGLGLVPHPEWSWWATRGQLISMPGYMANYALSAIVAAAVRERLRSKRGAWWSGDPGWYGDLADGLLRPGFERTPAALLYDFLGGPVTAEPLLRDLQSATA